MDTFLDNEKLLLDEETLKSILPSTRNITDTQSMYYAITMSQKRLKSLVGIDQFELILEAWTEYIDSGTTLSDCYSSIIHNYFQPILAFSTYKRLINHLSFKLKEGGLRYSLDQTTELADVSDREIIQREITSDIDIIIKEMRQYIYENRGCFPKYNQGFDGICDYKKNVPLNIGKI